MLGTALLLTVVIGSGVMGERLAVGHTAIALLANSLATAGGLYILMEVFAPISAPTSIRPCRWSSPLGAAWPGRCVCST